MSSRRAETSLPAAFLSAVPISQTMLAVPNGPPLSEERLLVILSRFSTEGGNRRPIADR